MFQIELKSRKAIYEQVIDNFKRLIITGVIAQDEKVPSVRDLAQQLTVNPNTVQKAYRILETQGYFYTVPGKGNFIAVPPATENQKDIAKIYSQLQSHIQELLYRGEPAENINDFVGSLTNANSANLAQLTKGDD